MEASRFRGEETSVWFHLVTFTPLTVCTLCGSQVQEWFDWTVVSQMECNISGYMSTLLRVKDLVKSKIKNKTERGLYVLG